MRKVLQAPGGHGSVVSSVFLSEIFCITLNPLTNCISIEDRI